MKSNIYIHYGSDKYDPKKFIEPRNRNYWAKPFGGLWASNINAEWGWIDWCMSEEFNLERLQTSFTFGLKDDAKILLIAKLEDAKKYIIDSEYRSISGIDFESIMNDGYDAVELIHGNNYRELHFSLFNTWDCDSIVILNKNVIIPIEDI